MKKIIYAGITVTGLLSFTVVEAQAASLGFSTTEIDNYLNIGMRSSDIGDAVNVQNTELGADRKFLSDGSSAPNSQAQGGPNTRDVFFQGGDRWASDSVPPSPAALVFEGIDYSGNTAITADDGEFSFSDVDFYADLGVQCANTPCDQSVSNSTWFDTGETIGSGGSPMPSNGVFDFDPTDLLGELANAKSVIQSLTAESTITSNIENENDKDGSGPSIFDLVAADTNNDGIAVIDIIIDGGNSDFELNNSDWILQGTEDVFGIFRIRGESNFNISNSSILLGDGGIGDQDDDGTIDSLGAIFFKGDEEGSDSSDKVFNGNNVILNGIGLWDLVTVGDDGNTELGINNGQGCAQFISSSIDFNDVRWNKCTGLTEPDDDGTIDDGTVDDGTVDDGTVDDGTVDDGTVDDGTVDDGTVDDGTVDDGTVDDGTVDDGTVDDGTVDDGTVDDGTVDDGTVDDGTVDDGTVDDGTVDDGTVDDGTVDDGTVDDGGDDDGTVDDGTVDDGTVDDGTVDDGGDDDGTVDDGSQEIPEPTTIGGLLLALGGLVAARRKSVK